MRNQFLKTYQFTNILKKNITNLILIKLTREAKAFYTKVASEKFKILQIILEVYKNRKECERKTRCNKD